MLFTQKTEAGIGLENAMLLTEEQLKKVKIPANNARISEWARDNHVNIGFFTRDESDFNLIIGIMQDSRISDAVYQTNKKMLKHLGDELIKFIDDLPAESEEAAKSAEDRKILDALVDKFHNDVKAICGDDTLIKVEIFKLREVDPDELIHMLMQNAAKS